MSKRPRKYHTEPISCVNTRLTDREDCESYLECLTEASKNMAKKLPCEDCPRYKKAAEEKEYFQRRFENRW
jgi:hypothetical protein